MRKCSFCRTTVGAGLVDNKWGIECLEENTKALFKPPKSSAA